MASVISYRWGFFGKTWIKSLVKPSIQYQHLKRIHISSVWNVAGQEVKMPSLSPTMTEGKIVKWLKKEGDVLSPGDVLCEIQTDKAVMSFETEEEGILAKILVPEDSGDVKVGTLIALTVAEGEDWKTVDLSTSPSSPTPSGPITAVPSQPLGGNVPGQEVKMPSLSPTMTEGMIVSWLKKEGDSLAPGDVLCEIQTDKAVMSFETEEEGILAKILVPEGTKEVKVGSLIALMVGEGEDWRDVAIPDLSTAPAVAPTTPAPSVAPVSAGVSKQPHNYGPAVLRLLSLYRLRAEDVAATGRNNKLLKGDVLRYITERALTPQPPEQVPPPGQLVAAVQATAAAPPAPTKPRSGFTDHELSGMRKTIAKRLTMSKTEIPHGYSQVQATIDPLLALRKQLAQVGVKVSVNDFVIKAVALALRQCPYMNTLYVNNQVVPQSSVDISIAVATDVGLITPIVKAADLKSVDEISADVRSLADRARLGKLQLHEFQGGSFTISNLGMFGIAEFSAIINPPQCAILAVGGGQQILTGDYKTATVMTSTLSYDGRAVEDAEVAEFLAVLKGFLQNPAVLMLPPQTAQRSLRISQVQ